MTQRLPTPGGDDGNWGDILNNYLEVSLDPTGYLNADTVGSSQITYGAVGTTQLAIGAVGTNQIANNAITSNLITAGAVGTSQIASGAITNTQLDSPTQTSLASVAGKYTKPGSGIPASDMTTAVQTALTQAGAAYDKPGSGIPSTDMTSAVQSSLTAANTAVQTVNSISPTSGNIALKVGNLADVSGASGATNNQVLSYNSTASTWGPSTVSSTTVSDASSSAKGIVQLAGDLGPGTNGAANPVVSTIGGHTPVTQSTTLGGDLTGTLPNPTVSTINGHTPVTTSTTLTGGDLSGTLPSPTVAKVNGITVTGTPSANQVLTASSSTAASWANVSGGASNATTSAPGLVQLSGDLSGSATAPTVAKVNGITVTGTPSANQILTASSSSAATWSTPSGGASNATSSAPGLVQLAGDLSGSATGPTVNTVLGGSTPEITTHKNAANGYAGLDSGGLLHASQLPTVAVTTTTTAGAPTTGTWITGESIIDSNGIVWICTAGGTPGTWAEGASGSGSSSGISISSPTQFVTPNYNATSSAWVPTRPRYYDITQPPFNVTAGGSSDQGPAINAALAALGPLGIVSFLPPGIYNVATQIKIGNANTGGNTTVNQNFTGPADSVSTWTALLEGASPPEGTSTKTFNGHVSINPALSETELLWTGGNNYLGAMVVINGPISSAGIKNIHFSGNSSYANGPSVALSVLSSRASIFENLTFDNFVCGIFLSSVVCANAYANNCYLNVFRNVQVLFNGKGSTANQNWGLMFTSGSTGSDPGPSGNSCYNSFYDCNFSTTLSGNTTWYAIIMQGGDSNRFYNINAHIIAFDYGGNSPIPTNILPQGRVTGNSNGGEWPAGCKVYDIEQGGTAIPAYNLGSPAVDFASPNEIHHTNIVNGPAPNPYLSNLKWNNENLSGIGTLSSGVFTMPGWTTAFMKNGVIGGSPASTCYIKAWYTSLNTTTTGPTGTLVPYISTNGSTATITSYTGSSVNTADFNNIAWEIVYS